MRQVLIVFLGGGLGSIFRYLVSKKITNQLETYFPLGTLIVNILGCFFIGVILALVEKHGLNPAWSLLLATGFCGSFTTFSSFAYENNLLLINENYTAFVFYTFLSIILGVSATFLGMILIKNV